MSDVSLYAREYGTGFEPRVRCADCALAKRYNALDGLRCLAWHDDAGMPAKVEPNGWCYRGKERNG